MNNNILIVEDDDYLIDAISDTLKMSGYGVYKARNGNDALDIINRENPNLIISDIQMEPINGYELLKLMTEKGKDIPFLAMTAYGSVQKAVEFMHAGAVDYIEKPFEASDLIGLVNKYINRQYNNSNIISLDPAMEHIMAMAKKVAKSDVTVMVTGESGSGKEIMSRYIHDCSDRAKGNYIAINCAAIPENMLEAMLFGYEKGSFTGAYKSSPGKFEQANGGTLLLDEISEMDLALQAKLLRVLQEKEVERIGGNKTVSLDVRVIATSNRDMKEEVKHGRFREDLYYRLNVFPIHVPALRERKDDIIPLAEFLMEKHGMNRDRCPVISDESKIKMMEHYWPGNIRELENVIQRALILCADNIIREEDLAIEIDYSMHGTKSDGEITLLEHDVKAHEYKIIMESLERNNGSRKKVADELGISDRTLRYKLSKMRDVGIQVPR